MWNPFSRKKREALPPKKRHSRRHYKAAAVNRLTAGWATQTLSAEGGDVVFLGRGAVGSVGEGEYVVAGSAVQGILACVAFQPVVAVPSAQTVESIHRQDSFLRDSNSVNSTNK